ncbi:hypothetical protein MGU_08345 [Metarhizium guizhouense ARSEF 977]|uniref:Uncharacterized protein n=1 Tax=Metarhizium guizhouense (strain ARSEF 977) TaxID=1276136 RepID=A0A0B4GP51_METGA|nr:hypothetical protein MGU_08345 [Metarhizium guizhouense ARSEF 977]
MTISTMEFDDTVYDSDETLTVSSPTDSTGNLREFVVNEVESSDESSQSQDTQTREEEYLEILDYIIAALGDLRLMLRDDVMERRSRRVESPADAE